MSGQPRFYPSAANVETEMIAYTIRFDKTFDAYVSWLRGHDWRSVLSRQEKEEMAFVWKFGSLVKRISKSESES